MRSRISFVDFRKRLKDEGYSDGDILRLFSTFRRADAQTRRWVVSYLQEGSFPETEVEGITAEWLVETCGMKPLNAFISLDWLKHEPEEAKFFLMKWPQASVMDAEAGLDDGMEAFLAGRPAVRLPEEAPDAVIVAED